MILSVWDNFERPPLAFIASGPQIYTSRYVDLDKSKGIGRTYNLLSLAK